MVASIKLQSLAVISVGYIETFTNEKESASEIAGDVIGMKQMID